MGVPSIKIDKITLAITIISLITFFASLSVGLLLQSVLLYFIVWILTYIFYFHFVTSNHKLYLVTITLILLISSALFCIWTQKFSPDKITYYLIPICGILIMATVQFFEIRYRSVLLESFSLIHIGKYEKAIEKINYLLKSDITNLQHQLAVYYKIIALNNIGNRKEAYELIEELIEEKLHEKIKLLVLNYKFLILFNLRRYDEAEEFIDFTLEKYPKNHITLLYEALLLDQMGFKEDATNCYEDLLNPARRRLSKYRKSIITKIRYPKKIWNLEFSEILMENVAINLGLRQYNEVLECLNEVLELNSEYMNAWNIKGFVLAKLGRYDEALKCVNKSLEFYSENAPTLDTKGYIIAHSGKLEDALKYYQKALEIDSLAEETYYHKGKAHQDLKQYDESKKCFKKVLELNPNCELAKTAIKDIEGITSEITY